MTSVAWLGQVVLTRRLRHVPDGSGSRPRGMSRRFPKAHSYIRQPIVSVLTVAGVARAKRGPRGTIHPRAKRTAKRSEVFRNRAAVRWLPLLIG